jgi:hypothetical protein
MMLSDYPSNDPREQLMPRGNMAPQSSPMQDRISTYGRPQPPQMGQMRPSMPSNYGGPQAMQPRPSFAPPPRPSFQGPASPRKQTTMQAPQGF